MRRVFRWGLLDVLEGDHTPFLRVDENTRDYQPELYTGDRMEKFVDE